MQAFITKHRKGIKRMLIGCGIVIILSAAVIFGMDVYVVHYAKGYVYETGQENSMPKADCILVLGAGMKPNGEPSLMLRDRLNRAIELYRAGVSDRFLLTGDHGRKGYNEVQGMKDYIMANLDVPEDKIFMDHAGFSTYESMYRARDIFELHNPVVVTQKYHAYRAVYAARKLGLDAYAAPNKRMKYRNIWICKLREVAARDKEVVNLWIQPKPTYLGDKIPISGSGLATKDTRTDKTERER